MLKKLFIGFIILLIVSSIINVIWQRVDPVGYQEYQEKMEAEREAARLEREAEQKAREEEEERQEKIRQEEAELEAIRKANAWCEDPRYDSYAKAFNDRHPDHPIEKKNCDNSYSTLDIRFNGYSIFYKEYNVDDGEFAGTDATILNVKGEYADHSYKHLSDEDKKVIKAAYDLSDSQLDVLVSSYENRESQIEIDNKIYRFPLNDDNSFVRWSIEYSSTWSLYR